MWGFEGQEWCWKKHKEPLSTCVVINIMKCRRGSIMVWGCTSWVGVGELTKTNRIINREHYQNTLQNNSSMLIVKFGKESEEWVFQHDNDPKHTSKSTIKWSNDHAITILPWCPQSPDMNPIEQLWNKVGWRLQIPKDLPTSKDDLWKKL